MIKKVLKIFLILSLFCLGGYSIYIGVCFDKKIKPNYIFGEMLDKVDQYLSPFFFYNSNSYDNFTLNKSIKSKVSSTDNYKNKYGFNNVAIDFLYKQDKNKEKVYFSINKTDDIEIINYNCLIKDSTKYVFIDKFSPEYVNKGNCNYFESLSKTDELGNKSKYLHYLFIKTVKDNLKDEYFDVYKGELLTNDNKKVSTNQISFQFDNSKLNKILANIWKDLEKDSVFKNLYSDSGLFTVDFHDYQFFNDEASMTINIYTSKYLYTPLKYEIIYVDGKSRKVISYSLEDNMIYFIDNDSLLYKCSSKIKNDNFSCDIKNQLNENVGSFELDRNKSVTSLIFLINDNKNYINIEYNDKYEKNDNDGFNNEKNIIVKRDKELDLDIDISTNVSTKVDIQEEADKHKIYSSLALEDKEKFDSLEKGILSYRSFYEKTS